MKQVALTVGALSIVLCGAGAAAFSEVLRIEFSAFWADAITAGMFAVVSVLGVVLNLRDNRCVRLDDDLIIS